MNPNHNSELPTHAKAMSGFSWENIIKSFINEEK